jgi:hypothetical protein
MYYIRAWQFKFHELIYKNMFAPIHVMLQKLGMYYGSQAAMQLYKVVGSVDVLGTLTCILVRVLFLLAKC